jgi:hypothetical protein
VTPALDAHAALILAGTGLTPAGAARIAANPAAPVPGPAAAAASALRDGWQAAVRATGAAR